jgi:sugar-specific transcriptional regulator TrmB
MADAMIDELKLLGFTSVEAQIYLFLVRHPLATGYEVSKGTGVARANSYQALESLTAKECVTIVSIDPLRYSPVPPERLLKRIQLETARRCQLLEEQFAKLDVPDSMGHFWELNERKRIEARLIELIGRAENRLVASLWAEDLDILAPSLREARERGCTVILNLFGEAEVEYATIYQHEGPEKVVSGHLVALAIDFSEALVASLDEPATGVMTQNRTLVRVVEKLIRNEAYLAAIFEQFSEELSTHFGPHLVHLRKRLLPEVDAERLVAITTLGSQPVSLPQELS